MAVSRVKTWIAEILTFADLNGEFNNILNNGEDLGWPATKAKDLNGFELILDADADTSITADTDDQIDFRAGGSDVMVITSNGGATQAEMETGTATDRIVTPGVQHFHPSAAKAWAEVGAAEATPAIRRSYNVTSVTDTATGRMTMTWATDFSDADYSVWCVAGMDATGAAGDRIAAYNGSTKAAGTCEFFFQNTADALSDPNDFSCGGFGDLA